MKQALVLTLKILALSLAIWLIIYQADWQQILHYIGNIRPIAFIAAVLCYALAQILSAFRMRYYFARNNLALTPQFSTVLYFLGMLYNNILPGGISGDGYKIYALHKYKKFSKLSALLILLSDRASGLFALMLLTLLLGYATHLMDYPYSHLSLAALFFMTLIGYSIGTKWLLRESRPTALGAIKYSVPIQLLNMIVAGLILWGLDPSQLPVMADYVLIFMVASVLAILPISIGGAGIREVTFLYAATLLPIQAELGVALAVIFFIVNMSCAAFGLLFMHQLKHYN